MKFKNIKILNFLFLGIIIITLGCEEIKIGNDFLSKPPEISYSLDSVFSSADRAREALWNAYSTLPWGMPYVFVTDVDGRYDIPGNRGGIGCCPLWDLTDLTRHNMGWGPMPTWRNGTVTANNVGNFGSWGPAKYDFKDELGWEGIRDSYVFIDNVDRVPDMEESEKIKLKAEAKMIIATHYVQMFRHYGGILYVNHVYTPNEDMHLERLTIMQSVDTITSIIDEAKKDLPFELDNPAKWSGRFTSAGAMALKVKLLSFAASPLFNNDDPYMAGEAASEKLVWTGGYERSLWERLSSACEELISQIESSSYYGMVNTGDPRVDYLNSYYERGTGETLLSFRVFYDFQWYKSPDVIKNQTIQDWQAVAIPLHNYAKKFPMINGMSIENPASGYDPLNPYANRDPRLYEHVVVNGDQWRGRKAELWIGGRERKSTGDPQAYTGYRLRKWCLDPSRIVNKVSQWPYVRIPEIYLCYAEALNELNDGPTPEALMYANKSRERLGIGGIEEYIGKANLNEITKEEFLNALLNERAIELGCENIRWFDMVRYKMSEVFQTKDYAMDCTAKAAVYQPGFDFMNVDFSEHDQYFDYTIRELDTRTFDWQENFSPKYYLEPFPFSEVQKDYGLIQNPGWEF